MAADNNPDSVTYDLDDGLGGPLVGEVLSAEEQADKDWAAQGGALTVQRIVLPEGATRGDAIVILQKDVPNNEYGLPTFFYRGDHFPFDLSTMSSDDAEMAAVPLDYSDGYPTYDGGRIFWEQLPHEPFADFLLFQRFIDQAEDLGLRQLQILSMSEKTPLQKISTLAKEYYWQTRARAFDLFQIAADKKRRELRARKTENAHFVQAEGLVKVLMTKFEDENWINGLSAKEALDALADLFKIQRISLGLSANGNAGPASDNPNAGASAELIMRQITKSVAQGDDSVSLTPDLQALLMDSEFGMKAQELIFRVRAGQG